MISKSIKKLLSEEKAKAYDEALKKIKECTPDENGFVTIYPSEIFPELAESEDERIRKNLIGYIKGISTNEVCEETKDSWLAWLEKQSSSEVPQATGPDPVVAKFHIQDWITDGYRTERVLDIKGPDYILQSQDGDDTYYDPISYVDPRYHPWTIKDVRIGDILIDDYGIYVFEKPDDLDNTAYLCSCAYQYSDKKFEYTSMICNLSGARLASKDQCEDFFAWMKDAGYEWDPDEKRPIENKTNDGLGSLGLSDSEEPGTPCSVDCGQNWKDSDKEWLKAAISYVEHCAFTTIGKGKLATIAWLKSLEDKVWPEQVWDIDDEHNLQGIIDEIRANKSEAVGNDAGTYDRFLVFLESLRDRVGKPSYDPYKIVVESILAMCEKYESRMEDKESARDFLNNVRVKCKDAEEYDRNNHAE